MVTIIAREGVLSMTDLFNYLLHYPTVFQSCDPKLPPFTNLPSKLIVTALFGRFKKVIPHYRTEGVSIQSHLQLNVRLDSHMVLQQLLFQPNWERRSKIWCQYISTGIDRLKSIQLTASSWRQIFKSSLLYICISIRIFQLMWNICDCFFHRAAWVIIRALLVWRFYNRVCGRFPPHFTLVINRLKLQFDQSLSITSLVILLRIRSIRLDWSPSLPGSFAVLCVVMSPK
jgi:hypothetical protein